MGVLLVFTAYIIAAAALDLHLKKTGMDSVAYERMNSKTATAADGTAPHQPK